MSLPAILLSMAVLSGQAAEYQEPKPTAEMLALVEECGVSPDRVRWDGAVHSQFFAVELSEEQAKSSDLRNCLAERIKGAKLVGVLEAVEPPPAVPNKKKH